ncbi:MAG: hypothetical protein WBD41_17805 [Rhodococcus sp. (in: high G+C Gram-positive bacteria)]
MTEQAAVPQSGVLWAIEAGGHYIEESVSVYLMGDPDHVQARWVIDPTAVSGEPLDSTLPRGPESGNCECEFPIECAHRRVELERVPLPDGADLAVMLLEALARAAGPGGAVPVEVVSVRDPDGGTDVRVFVCGVEMPVRHHLVDAGAGWEWDHWCEHRDEALSESSPAVREVLRAAFDDPPGGEYVEGREGAGWLDEAPVS